VPEEFEEALPPYGMKLYGILFNNVEEQNVFPAGSWLRRHNRILPAA
jgi:hypothetical protein